MLACSVLKLLQTPPVIAATITASNAVLDNSSNVRIASPEASSAIAGSYRYAPLTPCAGNCVGDPTDPVDDAAIDMTFRHDRTWLSPAGVHPVLPATQSVLPCQKALRNRSSPVVSVAAVPFCAAGGGTLVTADDTGAHVCATFLASGVPVMAKTATLPDATVVQLAPFATSYATDCALTPIAGCNPIGPGTMKT